MTRLTRVCRAVGVGIAVTTATLAMTQVAHAQPPAPVIPPPNIQPNQAAIKAPPGNVAFLVGRVIKDQGFQNYKCTANTTTNPTTYTWVTTPDATLDTGGQKIHHSGGPTWTAVDDKSVVTKSGTVLSAPSPDPTKNIPWLLIPVGAPTGVTNAPGGLLTGTTFVQRVNTAGGLAPPKDQCDEDAEVGATPPGVPYTADYYFYKAAGKPSPLPKPGA
jgi:hypothetical protein